MPRKYQLDACVLPALRAAWEACRKRIGKLPVDDGREHGWVSQLHLFSAAHDSASVKLTLSRVCQGVPGVITALSWTEATIGEKAYSKAHSDNKSFGEAWRLAVAYAGFERLVRALMSVPEVKPQCLDDFTKKLQLPVPYPQLDSPPRERGNRQSNAGGYESHLKAFLNGRPVTDWAEALCLAKTLRHGVTHGSLTGKKIQQHALRGAIVRLTADLGRVVTAVANRLTQIT